MPPVYLLVNLKNSHVLSYKRLKWDSAPWDSPAIEASTTIPRLAAAHKKQPQNFCTFYPLLFVAWTVRGLWHEEHRLPKCCLTLTVGARHKCPCQYPIWKWIFSSIAPTRWSIHVHKQDIAIQLNHRTVAIIGHKSSLRTHSWAGVPLHRELVPADHALAPHWAKTVKEYYYRAQQDRWN